MTKKKPKIQKGSSGHKLKQNRRMPILATVRTHADCNEKHLQQELEAQEDKERVI